MRVTVARTGIIAAAALAGAMLAPVPAADAVSVASRTAPEVSTEASAALETFDAAWRIVRDTHFDPEMNGVDWEAVREELRPRAAEADSPRELRAVLTEMLGRLGQSHFAVFPGETVDRLDTFRTGGDDEEQGSAEAGGDGVVGFDTLLIDDRLVVRRVEPGYPAEEAGVHAGWVVTKIGDREVSRLIEFVRTEMADALYDDEVIVSEVVAEALTGRPGSKIPVRFLDGSDRPVERELERRAARGQLVQFGNLPPMLTRVESEVVETEGLRIGVVSLSTWMVPAMGDLDRVLFEFRSLDGVVFDLRGNPGGVGAMVMGTAGHFLDEKVDLGTIRMRTNSLRFAVNPRLVDPAGERVGVIETPLAILVDGLSGSTSEVFAGGMQEVGRARIVGRKTMGAVLPALMDRLPNDDVLYHAFAEYTTPSGITLEGRGVLPDEPVALTREGLLEGRDAQLDVALRWIVAESALASPENGSGRKGEP